MKYQTYITQILLFIWIPILKVFGTSHTQISNTNQVDHIRNLSEDEIRFRLQNLNIPFDVEYNPIVRSYLNTYCSDKEKSERILRNATIFFPLIEKVFREENVPVEFKYLAVLESGLVPTAQSASGALGLWQFMSETGVAYGCRMNSWVDERRDIYVSSKAAARYLRDLYNKFDNWQLALAAYNGGPSRIQSILKKSGGKSLKSISRHLTRETSNFVSAFIGAAYICNYGTQHGFKQNLPDLDLQLTEVIPIKSMIKMKDVADICNVTPEVIRTLNPGFHTDLIPGQASDPYYLVIPKRCARSFEYFLAMTEEMLQAFRNEPRVLPEPVSDNTLNKNYSEIRYITSNEDQLHQIADIYQVPVISIMAWNQMQFPSLYGKSEIILYQPQDYSLRGHRKLEIQPLVRITATDDKVFVQNRTRQKISFQQNSTAHYHVIQRMESLRSIAQNYPGVSPEMIMKVNHLSPQDFLTPGTIITIPAVKVNQEFAIEF